MPAIRKSMDLLNNFNEIFEYCRNYNEPVFVTTNGSGRLAVMSEEAYDELIGNSRNELYQSLQAGLDQINNGDYIEGEEYMKKLNIYLGK